MLYASALRRLGHVTQVVSPTEGVVFHNRLTHNLEVAQIGRRIAERLAGDEEGRRKAERLGASTPTWSKPPPSSTISGTLPTGTR